MGEQDRRSVFMRLSARRGWERSAVFLAAYAEVARRLGEPQNLTARQVRRWRQPDPPCPHPSRQRVLEEMFGLPLERIGFTVPPHRRRVSTSGPADATPGRATPGGTLPGGGPAAGDAPSPGPVRAGPVAGPGGRRSTTAPDGAAVPTTTPDRHRSTAGPDDPPPPDVPDQHRRAAEPHREAPALPEPELGRRTRGAEAGGRPAGVPSASAQGPHPPGPPPRAPSRPADPGPSATAPGASAAGAPADGGAAGPVPPPDGAAVTRRGTLPDDERAQSGLRFSVLGPVRVYRDGRALPAGRPQERALLSALLLRAGRTATASELVDALWGEAPPARAVAALRTHAFRLRKALGPGALISEAGGYAVRPPPGALDLSVCEEHAARASAAHAAGDSRRAREALRAALALWDGEPLGGVPGPYAEAQRSRLVEWRLALLEQRCTLDLELGDHTTAVAELTSLTAEHPLREGLRALLMLALYRCGRQAEALGVYADTRRLLIDELGVTPGPQLTELHQRVLNADPGLAMAPGADEASTAGHDRHRPAQLAQLPAEPPDFTGRVAVAERLRQDLLHHHGAVMAIASVRGLGGVGKTTLAVHVAHSLRGHFPDGQLYADLSGSGARPAAPHEVLGSFLRALGVPDSTLPEGVEERAALYRSKLADRRVLIFLDNVHDDAQARPLLPGAPGCAVLITGRSRLGGTLGARVTDLEVMGEEEALALFTRIVGERRARAERSACRATVAACGHLPLAIRIAAARLITRPGWTVAALAGRLADERGRLAQLRLGELAVDASFALSYGQLEAAQARAFRLLALPDGLDLSLDAARALLGADSPTDADADEGGPGDGDGPADRAGPGEHRAGPERRKGPEERRAHGHGQPPDTKGRGPAADEPRTGTSRHGFGPDEHQPEANGRQPSDAVEHGSGPGAPRPVSRGHRPATADHHPGGSAPGTDVEELLESLVDAGLLESPTPHRYQYHDLLRLFARDRARRADTEVERRSAMARLLGFYLATACRAYALENPGDRLLEHLAATTVRGLPLRDRRTALDWLFTEGPALLATVAQCATDPGLAPRAADVLLVAQDLMESGVHREAYRSAAHAVAEHARRSRDARTEGRARVVLGQVHHLAGRAGEARREAERALALGTAADDPLASAYAPNLLGLLAVFHGRHREAEAHFTQALRAFRADGNRYGETAMLMNVGRARLGLGEIDRAVAASEQAVTSWRRLGATLRLANGHYALGLALHAAGRYDEALRSFRRGLVMFEEGRQPYWAGMTRFRMGTVELAALRPASAAEHAEHALRVLRDTGGDQRLAEVLALLGLALERLGQHERARTCRREARVLLDRLGSTGSAQARALLDGVTAPRS